MNIFWGSRGRTMFFYITIITSGFQTFDPKISATLGKKILPKITFKLGSQVLQTRTLVLTGCKIVKSSHHIEFTLLTL